MQNREQVVEGIEAARVPLETLDPEVDRSDLRPLEAVFEDRTVIGLGESTHGTREFFRAKHRLIRFLVTELDVRVIGLETGFTATFALDEYVLRGRGDPEELLADRTGWHVATEGVLELIEWLRAFNRGKPRSERVRVYGIDIGSARRSMKAVERYLESVDPAFHDEHREEFADLEAYPFHRNGGETLDRERLNEAAKTRSVLEDRLIERKESYVSRSSSREWDRARHRLEIFDRACERSLSIAREDWVESRERRDRAMADTVDWILDHEDADRIVVWAHDGHVRNGRVESSMLAPAATMGRYLAERHGDEYYALGTMFGRGSFQAYPDPDEKGQGSLREWTFDAPREGSVPDVFRGVDDPPFFLDVNRAAEDDRLAGWLEREREILSIGAFFYEDDLERHYNRSPLPVEFDGLLFVEESTRARSLS